MAHTALLTNGKYQATCPTINLPGSSHSCNLPIGIFLVSQLAELIAFYNQVYF